EERDDQENGRQKHQRQNRDRDVQDPRRELVPERGRGPRALHGRGVPPPYRSCRSDWDLKLRMHQGNFVVSTNGLFNRYENPALTFTGTICRIYASTKSSMAAILDLGTYTTSKGVRATSAFPRLKTSARLSFVRTGCPLPSLRSRTTSSSLADFLNPPACRIARAAVNSPESANTPGCWTSPPTYTFWFANAFSLIVTCGSR